MIKRLFDLFSALIVLVLLAPFFLLTIVFIVLDSKGGPFYVQVRIGKDGHPFGLYKFRQFD